MDIVILFYCRCVPSFTISIGCAPCSMCVFLKLRSFLDNKCIIAFFLQFIFQSYCFIKRIIFPDLNCIIRILINDIPLVSICNRTIQNILCIRKLRYNQSGHDRFPYRASFSSPIVSIIPSAIACAIS